MSLLTRMMRPLLAKETRITPNSPTLAKIFGWGNQDELKDPYSQIPVIYAAVRAVGKVLSQTRVVVMRGEKEVGPTDPVAKLFERPNKMQSSYEFKEGIGTNLQVRGNAFVVKDEAEVRGIPVQLYCWPASYFTPKYNDAKQWIGWDVNRGGVKTFMPPERVVHLSGYNPNDELMGMAPLDVLKMSYKSMWDALVYNKKFFENDGTPPIIYKAATPLGEQYREAFKKDVIERRKGKAHAHEAQLIEGMDVTTLGFTQKDIQFLELLKRNDEEVLMVFGVTKTQVSKYEDVNYATALSQDKVFISNTCIPMMRQIEAEFNSQWLDSIGYRIIFDERSNAAMTYLAGDEAQKIVNLANAQIITVNEARDMIGMEPVAWGDEPPMPPAAPFSPVAEAARPKDSEPTVEKAADAAEFFDDAIGKARRTNTWNALNTRIKPVEVRCAKEVRAYFHDIERRALGAVGKGLLAKVADPDIDGLFNDEKLYHILRTYLGQSVGIGFDTMGLPAVNIEDPRVLQYLGERVKYMKGVNENAKAALKEKLVKVLQDALENKLTETEKTEAVRDVLKQGFSELKSHARTIARTEVHSAFAEGRWEACKEIDPEEVEWVSSRDPLVRDSHARLDGKRVPFGQAFANGCKYPLDPAGGAAEVCNCFIPSTLVEGMFVGGLKAAYSGSVRKLVTAGGKTLTVTPNHSILTSEGWMPANAIGKGFDLVAYRRDVGGLPLGDPYNEHNPSAIQNVFNALSANGTKRPVVVSALDLHGDGGRVKDSKIDVVSTNGVLPFDGKFVVRGKNGEYIDLIEPGQLFSFVRIDGAFGARVSGICTPAPSKPSMLHLPDYQAPVLLNFGPFEALSVGPSANRYTGLGHMSKESGARDTGFLAQIFRCFSGEVAFDKVIEVCDEEFSGHVYDLQSIDGYIMSNGIVSSNCRCTFSTHFDKSEGKAVAAPVKTKAAQPVTVIVNGDGSESSRYPVVKHIRNVVRDKNGIMVSADIVEEVGDGE